MRPGASGAAAPGLLWLLVDGLSHPLWQQLAPRLPLRPAAVAALQPLSPNCQTPPSLFSIWSGLAAHEHGLTGYDMPDPAADDPLATVDAFRRWPREVPMVWDRWAAAGGQLRSCAVPFVQPQRLGGALLSHTEVYAPPLSAPAVLGAGDALALPALGWSTGWRADAQGLRLQGAAGGEARQLRFGERTELALPATLPRALAGETHHALALHAARIEGEPRLIQLGFQPVFVHGRDAVARRAAFRARAHSVANPAKLHASGALGRHADQGGDGSAERLLLDLFDTLHRSFLADILWGLRAGEARLQLAYYPVIDLVSHQLLRYLDEPLGSAHPLLAGQIRARLACWLGELFQRCRAALPAGWRFVAHADHGMQPLRHDIAPNRCFAEQGWLVPDARGRPDPQRSLAFYHPAENGWLALHPARLQAAGLAPAQLVAALDRALPPGMARGFRLIDGPAVALAGGWASGRYLQPPPRTRLRAAADAPFCTDSRKGGDHSCWSDDPWLQGVLLELGATEGVARWPASLALTQIAPALMDPLGAAAFARGVPACP